MTVWDVSGAPILSDAIKELEAVAEKIAKQEKLLVNVTTV